MKIKITQIYNSPGINLPFSHHFQRKLSSDLSSLIDSWDNFVAKYGADFTLILNISAKRDIQDNDLRGPSVFPKEKTVEYTVFLPFDVIIKMPNIPQTAIRYFMRGAAAAFKQLKLDASKLSEQEDSVIESICSDPIMFKERTSKLKENGS